MYDKPGVRSAGSHKHKAAAPRALSGSPEVPLHAMARSARSTAMPGKGGGSPKDDLGLFRAI